jgi:hypothetical protein
MRCQECANCELYKKQQKFEEMKLNGELFYYDIRPFTKEEAEKHESLLHSISKPIRKLFEVPKTNANVPMPKVKPPKDEI